MPSLPTSLPEETIDFHGLTIRYDERVLRPREWTGHQSWWAADLAREVPDGPVLELCCGAGQIGLLAVRRTDRDLVCVDLDEVAVDYARRNAEAAGIGDRVQVRLGEMTEVIGPDERFPLVVADPPWVPGAEVSRFPEDPVRAIDGGADGLRLARSCVATIGRHLAAGGAAVLQLGTAGQVDSLRRFVRAQGLEATEVREHGDRGVLVLLRHLDVMR